jgi:hypothetical protein
MIYKFKPKPISEFSSGRFGIGMSYNDETNPRIIIKADNLAYSLRFPAFKTFEDRLEKAMGIEFIEQTNDFGDEDKIEKDGAEENEGESA